MFRASTYPRIVVCRRRVDRTLVGPHGVRVSAPVGVEFAQCHQRRHPAGLVVNGVLGVRAVQRAARLQHGFRLLAPAQCGQQLSHVQVRHCKQRWEVYLTSDVRPSIREPKTGAIPGQVRVVGPVARYKSRDRGRRADPLARAFCFRTFSLRQAHVRPTRTDEELHSTTRHVQTVCTRGRPVLSTKRARKPRGHNVPCASNKTIFRANRRENVYAFKQHNFIWFKTKFKEKNPSVLFFLRKSILNVRCVLLRYKNQAQ